MAIWFKRKTYGWGWTPSTWQGWLVVIVYVALLYFLSMRIDAMMTQEKIYIEFIMPILIATIALIRISYAKGEKPRWQWGDKSKSKPKSKIKSKTRLKAK